MTIKELEARTGLDRATIRFYEKEGLIAPKRQANGYRDYTEEEALTLEKIVLLRRLDMPLDIIRAVQRGEVPLGVALERQDEALAARQKETEQALRISRNIRDDGASYTTLQPAKYRAQLPPPKPPVLPETPKHFATKHPWRRFLARQLDTLLFAWPGLLILTPLSSLNPWLTIFLTMLAVLLSLSVLEGLFLSLLGTTPGKWLMGLRLQYRYYDRVARPTFRDAFLRTAHVLLIGCGLGLLPHICGILAFLRANRGDEQPWDYDWEYTAHEYIHEVRTVALLAVVVVLSWGYDRLADWQVERIEQYQKNKSQQVPTQTAYINSVNLIFASHWELADYRDVTLDAGGEWGRHRPELEAYDLTIELQEETLVSVTLTGPAGELSSALANGLWLGFLEARDSGDGLRRPVMEHLSDGNLWQVGDWRMEYAVQDGVATVTIQQTDEQFWR